MVVVEVEEAVVVVVVVVVVLEAVVVLSEYLQSYAQHSCFCLDLCGMIKVSRPCCHLCNIEDSTSRGLGGGGRSVVSGAP